MSLVGPVHHCSTVLYVSWFYERINDDDDDDDETNKYIYRMDSGCSDTARACVAHEALQRCSSFSSEFPKTAAEFDTFCGLVRFRSTCKIMLLMYGVCLIYVIELAYCRGQ